MTLARKPRERGHVLSDELVRAALDGRLSALVVPMRPQPTPRRIGLQTLWMWGNTDEREYWTAGCPLGHVGDVVWCREAWAEQAQDDGIRVVVYRAAYPNGAPGAARWRSAVQMQRPDSRLSFEIVGVRCEQLQSAPARLATELGFASVAELRAWWDRASSGSRPRAPRDGESWDENPWVFVASVRRVEVR